jgi:hypothetical protein
MWPLQLTFPDQNCVRSSHFSMSGTSYLLPFDRPNNIMRQILLYPEGWWRDTGARISEVCRMGA